MSHSDQQNGTNDIDDMGAIGRAYRDARDSDGMLPPPALDDAIRAAARRAVRAGPKAVGKSWLRKWTPQLSVAAVVVLSVSVVFVSIEERPDLAPAPIQQLAAKRATEAATETMRPLETKIVPSPPAPPAKPNAALVMEQVATPQSAAGALDSQVVREKAAVKKELGELRSPASPPALSAAATPVAPPVYAPPAPAAAPVAQAMPRAVVPTFVPPPEVIIQSPAAFPATVADAPAPARKEARADAGFASVPEPKLAAEKEKAVVAAAATGALRSRDAIDAPAKPASPASTSAPVTATAATPAAPPPPLLKHLAPTPSPAAPAIAAAAPARALEFDDARRNAQKSESVGIRSFSKDDVKLADKLVLDERPGPWLKRLLELREQDKFKELREEIAKFKKRHPDVVLPKTLTELPP